MRYLLDTNMVGDLVRRPQGQVTQAIRAVGEPQVCTSIIVAAELRYGATKRSSLRLRFCRSKRRRMRSMVVCAPTSSGMDGRSAAMTY
jgi:predicted nucleic acid-binding protein